MNDLYNLSNDTINKAYSIGFSHGYEHDLEPYAVVKSIINSIREAANFPVESIDQDKFYEEICKIVKNHYLPAILRGKLLKKESALQAAHHHQLVFKKTNKMKHR